MYLNVIECAWATGPACVSAIVSLSARLDAVSERSVDGGECAEGEREPDKDAEV